MIKVNNLSYYQSLMTIVQYCNSKQISEECGEKCKLKDICDCMEINPCYLAPEFPHEVKEND